MAAEEVKEKSEEAKEENKSEKVEKTEEKTTDDEKGAGDKKDDESLLFFKINMSYVPVLVYCIFRLRKVQ